MSCKRPLLCSTPFLASKRNLPYLEPSIIELSSFSCDDIDRPPAKTTTSTSTTEPMIKPQTSRNKSLQNNQLQRSNCQCSSQEVELVGQVEECAESAHQHPVQKRQGHGGREDQACERGQMSPSVEFASARTHLDSQVEQLKDRCRSASAVVVLEKVDVSDVLSTQSLGGKLEVEEMCSPCLEMELPASTNAEETWNSSHGSALSGSCPEPLYITSSLSPSFSSLTIPPPAPSSPPAQFSDPAQALIDRLKLECLSSCLTVTLQPLDHNVLLRFQQQAPVKSPEAQAVSAPPPETKRGSLNSQADLSSGSDGQKTGVVRRLSASYGVPSVPAVKSPEAQAVPAPPPESKCGHSGSLNSQADLSSESDGQKTGVVRRLSASYGILAVSPAADVAPSKARTLVVQKERGGAGAGAGTGRKACVSGLSVSRWSKRDVGDKRQRKNDGRTRTKPGDCSLNYLLPARMTQTGESMCDWLPGNSGIGLPGTPIRLEQLNLSVLANFTPDTLTTHNWGRLKAALSIHKKKTAFPTPRRLALSNLKSPGGMDTSLDLFGTPLVSCTPLSKLASSRLLYSSMTNTSMGPDEDISDAEKVYQECQQDGPLSFEDCIPPEQMKCCTKIGEGTFGEVFSTINSSSQTVALKIIPVEGSEKVNGEVQKTFGEILHEIIISKELSSLDSKENNKTNGFIGLNNLHCVQGCYPSALLKAWDKFDQEKTSENDRPDFFSKEQLFVILEFEFGGSDLENMNGKLTSMAQAKSLLHQVTAALAVAEQALCFEHRDLHWGNILVKTTKQKHTDFILNGSVYSVETRGVHVNIIDYSLSRLEIDGLTVSCDIANDEELFMGQGDYQFEIYRLMKNENNNCWGEYNPHSNVLWLHYLVDKLLTMKYKTKAQSSQQKTLKSSLKSFQSEILSYRSATDALQHCRLFQ
ncbi:uncharacterized protein haspin [Salminus brasiliensis]|uniref:uncharacterized protein haspin n=1 Tax=Salminus brasiliensis TaxID=930266 RepID=UPI003B82F905